MDLLHLLPPPPSPISCSTNTKLHLPKFYVSSQTLSPPSSTKMTFNASVVRRSANYQPPIWNHDFVESLTSEFTGETCLNRRDMLRNEVKKVMLNKKLNEDPLKLLELVDTLERLGLSYHFENETKQILENMNLRFNQTESMAWMENNLHATALHFRLLRQHGYFVPREVFNELKDEITNLSLNASEEKAKGMLSFYEATFLAKDGERFLEEARQYAIKHLLKYLQSNNNEMISTMIRHALELPLHWSIPRLEVRWFIDVYERTTDTNLMLLELAKLEFNIVQSIHQDELKYVSRWWNSIGLEEKLGFARDRLMTSFFETVGMGFEPHFGYLRRMCTKIALLITVIDDIYDVYGTLDELELFTNVVERWDIAAIDSLPDYMKICFIALHNTINDMAFDVLKDQGVNVIQYLRKMWVDLCKTFLIEAKWYYTNYIPTFQEYLDNAWISVSGPLVLVHAYVFVTRPLTKEALEGLEDYYDIIQYASIIFRLANDLAASSDEAKRGDVSKSLQCYMNNMGASEHEARIYNKGLITESWKKMNEEVLQILNSSSYLPRAFVEIVLNFARIFHTVYRYGDGHTVEDHETKDHVLSLFMNPISINI